MYGLPSNVDLAFFKGKALLQVCIGAHDLILNFVGDISVTVTSSIGCTTSGGSIQQYDDFRRAAPAVITLLDHSVVLADGDEAGTLTLTFDGGGGLAIYDDSEQYESYTIKNGSKMIVV